MIRYALLKNNVTLHTPTGPIDLSNPMDNMLVGILAEISQYDNVVEQTAQGQENSNEFKMVIGMAVQHHTDIH